MIEESVTPLAAATPDEWAIVEIMGHNRLAGRISQVTRFGAEMLRVDVPFKTADGYGFATKFYGGAAIYCVTPCTEEVARHAAAAHGDPRPVIPIGYRDRAQPRLAFEGDGDADEVSF